MPAESLSARMLSRNLRLFSFRGIPVEINVSWLVILALATWSFATGFYPEAYPGAFGAPVTWALSLLTSLTIFLSLLLHELSHVLVAAGGGLPVRRMTLFMFGIMAQMEHEADDPALEFRMAAAGPLMTLVLIPVFFGLSWLTRVAAFPSALFATAAGVNVGIFAFNMVPGFPLDGGRILRAAVWKRTGDVLRATRIASRAGRAFAWLLVAAGAFNLLFYGNVISGIWMALIGLFLRQAAIKGYRHEAWRSELREFMAAGEMRTAGPEARPGGPLPDRSDD